jgi:adenosylhomocysteinase
MSFANQALAAEYMALNHEDLETRVHQVPRHIDEEIARLKLASKGIEIDRLTDVQSRYLASWDQGT